MSAKKISIQIDLDRSASKAQARAFADDQKRLNQQLLSDEQIAMRAKTQAMKEENQKRIAAIKETLRTTIDSERAGANAAKASAKEAIEAHQGVAHAHKRMTDGGITGMRGLGAASKGAGLSGALAFGASQLALGAVGKAAQAATEMVKALQAAMVKAGEKSKEMAGGFVVTADTYRELATLMERPLNDRFVLDMARFNKRTMMTEAEGRDFMTESYNAGAQFRGRNISEKQHDQYLEKVGSLVTAKGMEPGQAGNMAGTILGLSDYTKFGDKASDVALGKFNSSLAILQHGKGGSKVLGRQFDMLASASLSEDDIKGTFNDADELAAAISVMAEKHDAQAAELVKMAARGLRGFGKKQGPLLKRALIDAKTGFTEGINKLAIVVQAEAKKRGLKVEDVLRENFEDEGVVDALSVGINKGAGPNGAFAERAAFAKTVQGPGAAMATIDKFKHEKPGQDRDAQADKRLANLERGQENAGVHTLRTQALAKLIRDKAVDTNATNIKDYYDGKIGFGGMADAEQKRIDDEAQRILEARTPKGTKRAPLSDIFNMSPTAREDDLRARMHRIEKAGADPLQEREGEAKILKGRHGEGMVPFLGRQAGIGPQASREATELEGIPGMGRRPVGDAVASTEGGGFMPIGLRGLMMTGMIGAIGPEKKKAPARTLSQHELGELALAARMKRARAGLSERDQMAGTREALKAQLDPTKKVAAPPVLDALPPPPKIAAFEPHEHFRRRKLDSVAYESHDWAKHKRLTREKHDRLIEEQVAGEASRRKGTTETAAKRAEEYERLLREGKTPLGQLPGIRPDKRRAIEMKIDAEKKAKLVKPPEPPAPVEKKVHREGDEIRVPTPPPALVKPKPRSYDAALRDYATGKTIYSPGSRAEYVKKVMAPGMSARPVPSMGDAGRGPGGGAGAMSKEQGAALLAATKEQTAVLKATVEAIGKLAKSTTPPRPQARAPLLSPTPERRR